MNMYKRLISVIAFMLILFGMSIASIAQETTIFVTTTADSGTGSLRDAITEANGAQNASINFAIDARAPHIITLESPLPNIIAPMRIIGNDACGTTDAVAPPTIGIDGTTAGLADGFVITQSASRTVISGLAIFGFAEGAGIFVEGATDVILSCNHIGLDLAGNAAPNGTGIYAAADSARLTVGGELGFGNVISGNIDYGVRVLANNSAVSNNRVGTTADGTAPLPNELSGIYIDSAQRAMVAGNLVSGNLEMGILIGGTQGTIIINNYVGTDADGVTAIPNTLSGIFIRGSVGTVVGDAGFGNLVSGNGEMGITVRESSETIVRANLVGVNISGEFAVPNGFSGVGVSVGSSDTIIGGEFGVDSNLISGNSQIGIRISDEGTTRTQVFGNLIGTDISGSYAIPNELSGVFIRAGATETFVGDGTSAHLNLISGNGQSGVVMNNANFNRVWGNYIGTDIGGSYAIPNVFSGASVENGARENQIGGSLQGQGNLISGNAELGVYVSGETTTDTIVYGNYIGTDISGSYAIPNIFSGVGIFGGAFATEIGAQTEFGRNLISGNGQFGVAVSGAGTMEVTIHNNYIGTDMTGTQAIPNEFGGVMVESGARRVRVGSDNPDFRNVISGNNFSGVGVRDLGSGDVVIIGNFIGSDNAGQRPLPNRVNGVRITSSADTITVGTEARGEGNLISFNGSHGVYISEARLVTMTGNAILSNGGAGAYLLDANADRVLGRNDFKNNCQNPPEGFADVCEDVIDGAVPMG